MTLPATLSLQSPYLQRKGIDLNDLQAVCQCEIEVRYTSIALFDENGVKTGQHSGPFVFRQLLDPLGEPKGYERILDQRVQRYPGRKAGDKYVTHGSSSTGFTPIGFDSHDLLRLKGDLMVCAGLADGYRIHQCTGLPVACGVGELNLTKIANQLATLAPHVRIVVVADNDNAGMRAALKSQRAWTVPVSQKDWSDLYQHEGPQVLREQLSYIRRPLAPDNLEKALEALSDRQRTPLRVAPSSSLSIMPSETDASGMSATLRIATRKEVRGYSLFKRYARVRGVQYNSADDVDEWQFRGAHGLALLMAMINAGLASALPGMEDKLADFEEEVINLVGRGYFDGVDVIAASPAFVTAAEGGEGQAGLRLVSAYDRDLNTLLTSAGGKWARKEKQWWFPAASRDRMNRILKALCSDLQRRMVFVLPKPAGECVVGRPGLGDQLTELYWPGEQDSQ